MYETLALIAYKQTNNPKDAWERYLVITKYSPSCTKEDFEKWYPKQQKQT